MSPDRSSNIRVFVHWHDQTVFAGEEVKCTITFKNVAPLPNQIKQQQQQPHTPIDRSRLASPLSARPKSNAGLTPPPTATTGRGHHRSALSMSLPPSHSHSRSGSVQWPSSPSTIERHSGHSHKRSVSIVSIGSANTVDDHALRNEAVSRSQRPNRGHSRAASLQIVPRGQLSPTAGPRTASFSPRQTGSPLFHASYPPDRFGRMSGPATAPNTPAVSSQRRSPRGQPTQMPEFRFPAAPPSCNENSLAPQPTTNEHTLSPKSRPIDSTPLPIRSKDPVPTINEQPAPATRILSSSGLLGGTPRSSGEFYSVSNHSSETLMSEYVTQQPARGHGRTQLRRSLGIIPQQSRAPESLMMGYAQIQGSFTLDGSLVNLGPFEQVKKKAIVGGQGGGVVGVESVKRDSGLFRGFGWGSLSNSLGDLLSGSELSTIKEMRGVANSKSIPLLSTPQSILFVDLQLAPGESRAYEYTFRVPKGLPPTHRGKAVKISYSIVVGTQRAGGSKEQQVRSVEVPFRVLGSVNSHGEILGHDLMNPYILLRDFARVGARKSSNAQKSNRVANASSSINDFMSYVDDLVTRPRDESGSILLSPTAASGSRRLSTFEDATTAKDAIHLAIMRSNMASGGGQSPNRFEIARNGQKVGTVMLTRPAYRLGEVVTMAIDFTDADIPCYAIHATLETSEKIDPSFAVRSESSVHRVTRKVYATSSEATLYSRRAVFTPTIPITATPEFVTSGVNLEWKIRVEFVVPSSGLDSPSADEQPTVHPLLEQISQDEKGGLVLVAVENLICESFDIAVPLRVYGAVGTGLERLERDEASEEGLAV